MGQSIAGGEFYAGGAQRFQKEGQPAPKGVEFPARGFEEKLHELKVNGAAEVVSQYRFGEAVKALLLQLEGDLNRLTEEECRRFIEQNPDFPRIIQLSYVLLQRNSRVLNSKRKREESETAQGLKKRPLGHFFALHFSF